MSGAICKQTVPVAVNELDIEDLKRIDLKKDEFFQQNPTLDWTQKEIHLECVYNIASIVGNPMSFDEIRNIVETKSIVSGKKTFEQNEILGIDSALRYVYETSASDIQVNNILEIHKRVMAYVNPIQAGTFRTKDIFSENRYHTFPSEIKQYMDNFVKALNTSPCVKRMHPIIMASFCNKTLMFIHPFLEGNITTSIIFMNFILLKNGYPPVIIRKKHQSKYFKLLTIAHESDVRPFYRFITLCVEYTLDFFKSNDTLKKEQKLE